MNMEQGQVIALLCMFFVGAFGAPVMALLFDELTSRAKLFIAGWCAVWMGPVLVILWVKGVMG